MEDTSIRFVITHISSADGLRHLTFAKQGRDTYGSRDEAARALRAFTAPSNEHGLSRILDEKELETLKIRAVACFFGSHDPVGSFCDHFSVHSGIIYRDGVPFMGISSKEFAPSTYGHSHTEIGALRHWIEDKLNALTSAELDEIVRKHMDS